MRLLHFRFIIAVAVCLFGVAMACLESADPKLAAVGIGVSDLEASTDFYTRVLGMKVKYKARLERTKEVVLEFADSKGADVILMNFTDGSTPNYKNNPAKLVFYVPDATAAVSAIAAEGLTILSKPSPTGQTGVIVAMAKDPDGYLLEIVEDETVTVPYLGAAGIGITNLDSAVGFYTRALGMKQDYRLTLSFMVESIMSFATGGSSAVVLMQYTPARSSKDIPVKLVFLAPSPQETMEKIRTEGGEILRTPKKAGELDLLSVGVAKDPDGYVIQIAPSLEVVEPEEKDASSTTRSTTVP